MRLISSVWSTSQGESGGGPSRRSLTSHAVFGERDYIVEPGFLVRNASGVELGLNLQEPHGRIGRPEGELGPECLNPKCLMP